MTETKRIPEPVTIYHIEVAVRFASSGCARSSRGCVLPRRRS
jgi:hypothetical protein